MYICNMYTHIRVHTHGVRKTAIQMKNIEFPRLVIEEICRQTADAHADVYLYQLKLNETKRNTYPIKSSALIMYYNVI